MERGASAIVVVISVLALARDASAASPVPDPRTEMDVERRPQPAPDDAPEPAQSTVELPGARFGTAGQLALTGAYGASISQTTFHSGATFVDFTIAPGIDWFVVDHLSIGVNGSYGHVDAQGFLSDGSTGRTTGTSWSGGARVGYDIPLGRWSSWYPRFTFAYDDASYDTRFVEFRASPQAAAPAWLPFHSSSKGARVELFAPILLHVRNHLFVGFGPDVSHSFAGVNASAPAATTGGTTSLSAALVVGGYFGGRRGRAPEADASPPETGQTPARFGELGTWAISAESSVSTSYAFADRSSYWAGGVRLAPTVDYFFTHHVAAGASLVISDGRSRVYDIPTGQAAENVSTRLGAGVRLGVSGNLASWLSVFPTGEIDVARADDGRAVSGQGAEHARTQASVSLFVPLLFHVTQHLFVGVGPHASADILSSRDDGVENKGVFIGASAVVGGWFKAPLTGAKPERSL